MGEGRRRQQALKAFGAMAVGPGQLNADEPHVLIVTRSREASMASFTEAVEVLVGRPALVSVLKGLDAGSIEDAEWVIVDSVHSGPGNLHLVRGTKGALELSFVLLADGLAERGLDWTTIVVGSDADRLAIRELACRYEERLRNRPKDKPRPVLAVSQEAEPKLMLQISHDEVLRGDLHSSLMGLDVMVSSRQFLDRFRNRLTISFTGYDEDPRHIGQIEETVEYLRRLAVYAPWAPLLSHKSMYMIWCPALDSRCVVTSNQNGMTKMNVPPEAATAIIKTLRYTAAEVNVHHLGLSRLHPSIEAAMRSWSAFLTDGSDELEAMEDGLAFGLSPDEVLSWTNAQRQDGRAQEMERPEMPSAGPSEKNFWESVVGVASPGWVVDVNADQVGSGLTSQDAVIYVLDTASGLVFAGGFPERDVVKVVETARDLHAEEAMVSFAIQTIRRLGREKVTEARNEEARAAILASISALGSTALFKEVQRQTGGLKGHWVYMVYQPKEGDPTGRSTYAPRDAASVFPLADLYEMSAEVIRGDMNRHGVVNSWITRSGGLELCEHLQKLVRGG